MQWLEIVDYLYIPKGMRYFYTMRILALLGMVSALGVGILGLAQLITLSTDAQASLTDGSPIETFFRSIPTFYVGGLALIIVAIVAGAFMLFAARR